MRTDNSFLKLSVFFSRLHTLTAKKKQVTRPYRKKQITRTDHFFFSHKLHFSPSAGYKHCAGYVSSGNDLPGYGGVRMAPLLAQLVCDQSDLCLGYTYKGSGSPGIVTTVWLKTQWDCVPDAKWNSYQKPPRQIRGFAGGQAACPAGPSGCGCTGTRCAFANPTAGVGAFIATAATFSFATGTHQSFAAYSLRITQKLEILVANAVMDLDQVCPCVGLIGSHRDIEFA